MKTLILAAAIAATGLFATSASAADGTITFNGNVTATTCTINGGSPSFAVNLPTVSTGTLSAAGDWAGRTAFSIALTGCTASGQTVSAYFEPGGNVNTAGRLSNTAATSPAGNVDLQLLNNTLGVIDMYNGTNNSTATITSGSATLNYYVQYYATAAATAGAVKSTVDYTIQYN